MLEYLFVYGTLRKAQNGSQHPDLKQAVFLSDAHVNGKLFLIAHYPGVVLGDNGHHHTVHGEIYHLPDPVKQLQKLDDYEECSPQFPFPHEYQRTTCIAALTDGSTLRTWIYTFQYATDKLTHLSNGDFWAYLPASYD
jgi:gamma-glutamylcyclotransferase (GGCT)/AIG2-like uncharacterized protein YtfP